MASRTAVDNAISSTVASLTRALQEQRNDLERQHLDIVWHVQASLCQGLGISEPARPKEILSSVWETPSKASPSVWESPTKQSESSRSSKPLFPHFAGDFPVKMDEESEGRKSNQKGDWNLFVGCCTPSRSGDAASAMSSLPTPVATPQKGKASSSCSWKPAPVEKDSAMMQVLTLKEEETRAEEFFRETMESLKDPLLVATGKKAQSASRPETNKQLQALLDAWHFDVVVSIVIIGNLFFIGYSTQHAIEHWRDPEDRWLNIGEWSFIIFFMLELVVRLRLEGIRSFATGVNATWNGFDFFLIVTAFASQMLSLLHIGNGSLKTSTSLRVLRLLKMIRMLRVLRGASMLHELRALLSSIASCCRILFWAIILMLFIYYTFGLVFMNAVANAMPTIQHDVHLTSKLYEYYGTIGLTMLTLFMSTTGGMDWAAAANVLYPLGSFYYFIFLFYVSVVSFAILKLITGLFVDGAMKAAEKDRIHEMQESRAEQEEFKEAVKQLFMEMVKDEDGILDREELALAIQEPRMKAFMEWVQYDTNEIITLFRILDKAGGSKGVTFEFFVESCFRFGQQTKGLDLLILLDDQAKIQSKIAGVSSQLKSMTASIKQLEASAHRGQVLGAPKGANVIRVASNE